MPNINWSGNFWCIFIFLLFSTSLMTSHCKTMTCALKFKKQGISDTYSVLSILSKYCFGVKMQQKSTYQSFSSPHMKVFIIFVLNIIYHWSLVCWSYLHKKSDPFVKTSFQYWVCLDTCAFWTYIKKSWYAISFCTTRMHTSSYIISHIFHISNFAI